MARYDFDVPPGLGVTDIAFLDVMGIAPTTAMTHIASGKEGRKSCRVDGTDQRPAIPRREINKDRQRSARNPDPSAILPIKQIPHSPSTSFVRFRLRFTLVRVQALLSLGCIRFNFFRFAASRTAISKARLPRLQVELLRAHHAHSNRKRHAANMINPSSVRKSSCYSNSIFSNPNPCNRLLIVEVAFCCAVRKMPSARAAP